MSNVNHSLSPQALPGHRTFFLLANALHAHQMMVRARLALLAQAGSATPPASLDAHNFFEMYRPSFEAMGITGATPQERECVVGHILSIVARLNAAGESASANALTLRDAASAATHYVYDPALGLVPTSSVDLATAPPQVLRAHLANLADSLISMFDLQQAAWGTRGDMEAAAALIDRRSAISHLPYSEQYEFCSAVGGLREDHGATKRFMSRKDREVLEGITNCRQHDRQVLQSELFSHYCALVDSPKVQHHEEQASEPAECPRG